ncbi:unnamed protein product [Owenia fusiformis]|uniref:L-Fucosyltransferase n=1 Tax=Owenia fusiformis TaxID=6347 RepID=A0A8J1TRX0_OWEFU|nr:unnamed protein product [Owenia fusiformis]
MWSIVRQYQNNKIILSLVGIQWMILLMYIFLTTHQDMCLQRRINIKDSTEYINLTENTKKIQTGSFNTNKYTELTQKISRLEKSQSETIKNPAIGANAKDGETRGRFINETKPQICVVSLGLGIGNRIFQFAGIFGITNGTILPTFSKTATTLMDTFNITLPDKSMSSKCEKQVKEKYCCVYDKTFTQANLENLSIRPYFQTWRYFQHMESKLRSALKFHEKILQTARMNLKKLGLNKTDTMVNIHIRRGDMQFYGKYGFKVAPMSYINHSMEYFKKKYPTAKFIVYSNDMVWCKAKLAGNERLVFAENNSVAVDLAMASLGTHTIMTVGTFGWWLAWFTGGETVYYKDWPIPNSPLAKSVKHEDYFHPNWKGMI